ncbi:hypothetical protein NPIL_684451 [Nephila pilipes]|uniref:Uncharacterized protein n=1 Tax=Nephila pilipes TaxID=299642 RepID=A0A8X6UA39_NEPPI|nr:hypothetical protein NPIL_391731 [Nephila pilipes]GFT90287.1 hypothetical protein NPIL_343091 [Nephila pilipes]GFT99414.1 hypothetical protein NPIL_684451 [Nephila pilipes]
MKVENNNVVIWKGGKLITVNVDQVRIYHPRERDESVVDTEGLDGERSRAEQVETEGSRKETCKEKQRRIKRRRSEGSTESSNKHESQHQSKRRPHVRRNWRKCSAPSSLVENIEAKRRPHESCKWRKRPIPVSLPLGPGTRKMTRREATEENQLLSGRSSPGKPRGAADTDRQVLLGRSSPYRLRSRRHIKEGQEESRRSSPYPLRNRLSISEKRAATERTSPYLTRAGGVETARSRSRFRPNTSDSAVMIVKGK